jgi:hypothetical protein
VKAPPIPRPAAPIQAAGTCSCGRKLRRDFAVQRSPEGGQAEAVDPGERLARADRLGHSLGQVRSARDLLPKSSGRALPVPVRRKMEESLGGDLSAVRIHEGPEAPSIGAVAFTRGTSIHFAPGKYDPASRPGQRLLGHELAHVIQQRRGRVAVPRGAAVPINDDPSLESEADRLGERAAQGKPAAAALRSALTSPVPLVQRKTSEDVPEPDDAESSRETRSGRFFSHLRSGGRKLLGGLGVAGGAAALGLGTLADNQGLKSFGSWGFSKGKALLKPLEAAKPPGEPPKELSKAERIAASQARFKALANKRAEPKPEEAGSSLKSKLKGGVGVVSGLASILGGIVTANPLLLGRGAQGIARGISGLRGKKKEPEKGAESEAPAPAAEAAPQESHAEEEAQERAEERAQEQQEQAEEQSSGSEEENQASELEAQVSSRQQGRFPSSSQRRAARRGEHRAAQAERRNAKARQRHLREIRRAARRHQRRQRGQQRTQRQSSRRRR